ECLERVRFLHENLGADAIVEEFIDGRELYVGVLGSRRPKVLPPQELFFDEIPEGEPRFATFKAKWDDRYRKKWGIRNGPAKEISEPVRRRLRLTCRKIYNLFQLSGYARIDLRLTPAGDLVFLEANPNPSLASGDDFARSAERAGLSYTRLISRLLKQARRQA